MLLCKAMDSFKGASGAINDPLKDEKFRKMVDEALYFLGESK